MTPRSRCSLLFLLVAAAACHPSSGKKSSELAPAPVKLSASTYQVDSIWNRAVRNFRSGSYGHAAEDFQRALLELVPGDPRIPEAHFFLGESYFGSGSQLQAVREFRRVSDEYPNNPLAPDALGRAGDAYADLWSRPELDPTYGRSAIATYTELLNRYPESQAAAKARVQLTALSDKFAWKEWEAAQFYLKLKQYDAGILYLKSVVATYPDTPAAQLALVRLVTIYQSLGYTQDAKEMCGALRQYHPGTANIDKLCPTAGG
jgi:outer membrane protein assembly factor BamD